jgi:hypothetical protein
MTTLAPTSSGSRAVTALVLLLAGVMGAPVLGAPLFPNPVYPVGTHPIDMARADFDGDGVQDLIVANITNDFHDLTLPGDLSLLRGVGDGSFQEEERIPLSHPALKIFAADFDEDGHPDLAVSFYRGAALLFGTSGGFFGGEVPLAAAGFIEAIDLAHVNADAHPDLLVTGGLNGSGFTQALLGAGDGTFTEGPVHSPNIYASAVADVDGDGLDDFLTIRTPFNDPCPQSNTIQVFLGQGDGAFVLSGTFTTGIYTSQLLPADLDGDGDVDLVINAIQWDGCSGYGGRLVYHGNGDGTFSPAEPFEAQVQTAVVITGDLNSDGRGDYIDSNNYTITVHLGQSDGTTLALQPFYGGVDTWALSLGDFDQDGRTDLAALANRAEAVFIFAGNGDGTFGPPRIPALEESGLQRTATADFNGDGAMDIVATGYRTGDIVIVPGAGDGTFGPETRVTVGPGPYVVAAADFNADGQQDVAVTLLNWHTDPPDVYPIGSLAVLLGNGDGSFQSPALYDAGRNPLGIVVSDFNGDGVQDVVLANWGDGYLEAGDLSLYLGNGDGSMAAQARIPVGVHFDPLYDPTTPASLGAGDFNGDSHQDLVVGMRGTWNSTNPGEVEILFGDGDGAFTPPNPVLTVWSAESVAVGDLNGDGHADIAVADPAVRLSYAPGGLYVLLGQGDGTFGVSPLIPAGPGPSVVRINDFNADDQPDLAAVNNGGYLVLLAGRGDGTFGPRFNFGMFGVPLSILEGDFNADGKPDLMVVTEAGAFFFENAFTPPPPPPPPLAIDAVVVLSKGGPRSASIRWTTNAESDLRGFNILRVTNQGAVQLNTVLIPCLECVTEIGSTYTFMLAKPKNGQGLYIEVVHRDGRKETFGPARVE